MSGHLTRLSIPKSWKIKKKGIKWVTKPLPGPHKIELGLPLNIIFKDFLGFAKTNKEVKSIVNNEEVLVDGIRRKEIKFIIGLMDVITIPKIKSSFRILFNKKGYLVVKKIEDKEAKVKLAKIVGKTSVKKKIQLNLHDGKSILVEKDSYKVGDSILIEVPSQKIVDHFKLEKGSSIFLTSGKYIGSVGSLKEIEQKNIVYKSSANEDHITLKKYAFVVGKEKPAIDIEVKE